tara:strand:- start:385 stop:666 length:282 start_codon:yes stop_codon:yes gene_type:complete
VSQNALNAVEDQLANGKAVFDRLVQTENAMLRSQELGTEFDYANYEKQMADMEKELNDNVKQSIQDAINTFGVDAEDIDTDQEFEELRIRILD